MRAIILAAGAGTRLGPLTKGRPKCLVPVAGRPLLDHQVEALRGVGTADIVVVVGYEAAQVQAHCGDEVCCVENPGWRTTNSIVSLFRVRAFLDRVTFLCNCDILFHPEVLTRLAAAPGSAIAVDSRAPRRPGEMNVRHDGDGRVQAIGKRLDPSSTQAVSVQLARFDREGAAAVRTEVERLVAAAEHLDAFPPAAYGPLIAAGRLGAVETGDLPWGEIDSPQDLERAEREVAPRLSAVAAGTGCRR